MGSTWGFGNFYEQHIKKLTKNTYNFISTFSHSLIKVFFFFFFPLELIYLKCWNLTKLLPLGCQKFENYPNFLWHLNLFATSFWLFLPSTKMIRVWGCQCDVLHEVGLGKVEKRGSMKVS